MLDRLRDLYSPRREENTTEVLKKQFRRLQSPWGLLREKEPVLPETVEQTAETPLVSGPSVPATPAEPSALPMGTRLEPLIAEMEKELRSWPGASEGQPTLPDLWRRRQTDLRLLYLIADRSSDAVSVIESLPEEEQEFWQSLMLAMTYYRGTALSSDSPEERMVSTVDQLRIAARHAQSLSPLRIRRMTFCSAVNSFGNVDSFPTADFNPGQPVLIYAEIENFRAERTANGTWRSEFSAVMEIRRNDDAEPIETIRIGDISDESMSQRTDYFQSYEMTIPQLAPGRYALKIRLRDRSSQQQAESTLEFNIR